LKKAGLKHPTKMQAEQFSRDFTCNTLLLTSDLKTIKDPTGLGITDIDRKIIRTCFPASYFLGIAHHKVIRVFYLAAKLGFDVDEEIIKWIKDNPGSILNTSRKYVIDKLTLACKYDIAKTVELLDKTNTWKIIPVIPDLIPYLKDNPARI
jgi:tRNA nucleotidyltransferase/poly(A) polymerase